MKNTSYDWLKLDNAAKIFPGQNSRTWSNVFRMGAQLKSEIDPQVLSVALKKIFYQLMKTFRFHLQEKCFYLALNQMQL